MGGDFHYIVLFRLREGVPLERVRAAKDALASLVETSPGVRHFVVTENVAQENGGFRLALISNFENRQAFDIFARRPEVRAILDQMVEEVAEDRVVVQGAGDA